LFSAAQGLLGRKFSVGEGDNTVTIHFEEAVECDIPLEWLRSPAKTKVRFIILFNSTKNNEKMYFGIRIWLETHY